MDIVAPTAALMAIFNDGVSVVRQIASSIVRSHSSCIRRQGDQLPSAYRVASRRCQPWDAFRLLEFNAAGYDGPAEDEIIDAADAEGPDCIARESTIGSPRRLKDVFMSIGTPFASLECS